MFIAYFITIFFKAKRIEHNKETFAFYADQYINLLTPAMSTAMTSFQLMNIYCPLSDFSFNLVDVFGESRTITLVIVCQCIQGRGCQSYKRVTGGLNNGHFFLKTCGFQGILCYIYKILILIYVQKDLKLV